MPLGGKETEGRDGNGKKERGGHPNVWGVLTSGPWLVLRKERGRRGGVREKEERGREVKEREGRLTLMRKEGPIHMCMVYIKLRTPFTIGLPV